MDENNTQETKAFVLSLIRDVFSGEQKHELITFLADALYNEDLLTEEEAKDAFNSAKLFLRGKTFKQVYKKSSGIRRSLFRLHIGHAEIFTTEDGYGAVCYSPLSKFVDTLRKLSVKEADEIMAFIIEKMRVDGVITKDEADEAFMDPFMNTFMDITDNEIKSQGMCKVLELINEDYVFLLLLRGKFALCFNKDGNIEAIEEKLK